MFTLNSNVPEGPLETKWQHYKQHIDLVSPGNRRKFKVIVVGTGLAGGSAAASLGEMGYQVDCFCLHDSPRRAHSIAAQGGINAAKNYQNDGDSTYRLCYDTIKGGDYRSREANVYRLAELSANIIDQCVAQGVPFAREYGGLLANRTFGGVQVSRTFYARGQTGQQLLLGAYSALNRQIAAGHVTMYPRYEMLDLVKNDEGHARGIVTRNMLTGEIKAHAAHAVVLATGGYGNVFFLSTNGMGSNVTAGWRCYKRGAAFANPCYTQIHPTCIPQSGEHQSKLTLMSESLRNDGRIWVPKKQGDNRAPNLIPEDERDYYLERRYPAFGNMVPRDVASRAAKERCDAGYGVGATGKAVYLDFKRCIEERGEDYVREKYGNLFQIYETITGQNPYQVPMMIYPAVHYTMGGVWVDYNLQTTVPGLFCLGEANFSDHGANRLGASALMQGLADGYFVIPYTIGNYLAKFLNTKVDTSPPEYSAAVKNVRDMTDRLLAIKGNKSVDEFHRELGAIMWDKCGMARTKEGLTQAIQEIQELKKAFWAEANVPGANEDLNQALEKAARVADFFELGELMCRDALAREESCGGHFREEHQDENNEAKRDDENFAHVAAWEYKGEDAEPERHVEPLVFEEFKPKTRSYK